MRRRMLWVIGMVLIAHVALAQGPVIPAASPFKVAFTHDGINTAEYRVYVDGPQASSVPVSARTPTGSVVMDVPGVSAGAHALIVSAVGPGGETKTGPIAFTATVPPPNAISCASILVTVVNGQAVATCQ